MIVVALFTVLIAPYYIDWSTYRSEFERETSRILGQKVEVLGETKVRLLPFPSVIFGGLVVGRNDDGTPMMTVDQFAMGIELSPLLKNEIQIVELNLVRPRITVNVNEDGGISWINRQENFVDPRQVKLENFKVTNGEIHINGLAGGRSVSLEQLDGQITAQSLLGPWRIKGDGYFGRQRANFDLSTGLYQPEGKIRIKLAAEQANLPYSFNFDGPMSIKNELLNWRGDFFVSPIKTRGDGNTSRQTALPILVAGKFDASPHHVEVPEFRIDVGARDDPYTISGSGSAQIHKEITFDIKADGRQIDLDRLAIDASEIKAKGLGLEQRLEALRHILDQVPIPQADGNIEISLPAIIAGDTLVREIKLAVSPQNSGWRLRRLDAIFPGNTKLEAQGLVELGRIFGFSGSLLVATRQPTGLAAWLGKKNDPWVRKLREGGFAADVIVSENQTSFENLELILNDAVLNGKLQRISGGDGRAALIANLEGKRVNLDDLRAISALLIGEDREAVTNHDLEVQIKAQDLSGFDISARDVDAHIRVKGGTLSIEKLSAGDFFGARISSSGRVENLLQYPGGKFTLALQADDSAKLLQFLNSRFGPNENLVNLMEDKALSKDMDLLLDFTARAEKNDDKPASGRSRGLARFSGSMAGTSIDINIGFDGSLQNIDEASLDVTADIENEDPVQILGQLNLPVLPIKTAGPLAIHTAIVGKAKDGFDAFGTMRLPGSNFTADGKWFPTPTELRSTKLGVTFVSENIEPLLVVSGARIPDALGTIFSENIPAAFSGEFSFDGRDVGLTNGQGHVGGNELEISGKLAQLVAANPRFTGELSLAKLDLDVISSSIFTTGVTGLIDDGRKDHWNSAVLSDPIFRGLDAQIDVKIAAADLGLGPQATDITGQFVMSDGSINLNSFDGNWLDGRFSTNLSIENNNQIGAINAQYEFKDLDLERVIAATILPQFASGRLDLIGNIEGAGRSPAAIVAGLTGSGTAEINAGDISDINVDPMARIIQSVDVEGFEISDSSILPLVSQEFGKGSIRIDNLAIPFIVTGGIMRARNVTIESEGAELSGAVELSFVDRNLSAELGMRFDPGIEWVDGSEPEIKVFWDGKSDAPEQKIDVQQMAGYLSIRNFEREQRRVDILQARIMEKQRLRRDIIVTNARVRYRKKLADDEIRRQRQSLLRVQDINLRKLGRLRHLALLAQERALVAEAERKRKAEEARLAAEAEHKRKAEEARLAAEAERKRKAEETRLAAEAERKRKAEEARLAAEAERKRKAEEARLAAEAERKRKAEEARLAAEAERKRKVEEARLAAEAERKRKVEEARLAAEAERKRKAEEARLAAEAERKRKAEAARLAAEVERKRKAEEARLAAEAERKRKAEEARLAAEAERKRKAEAERIAEEKARLIREEAAAAAVEAARNRRLELEKIAAEEKRAAERKKRAAALAEKQKQQAIEEAARKAEREKLKSEEEVKPERPLLKLRSTIFGTGEKPRLPNTFNDDR